MDSFHTIIEDLCPPGEILAEALQELGLSAAELSRRSGVSEKHISDLLHAKSTLSTTVAGQLERVLGISAKLLCNIELSYRTELQREAELGRLATFAEWMRKFPMNEMRKAGFFGDQPLPTQAARRVDALLRFFGVASPDAWEVQATHMQGQFRMSTAHEQSRYALTAWLRQSRVLSTATPCNPFSRDAFESALVGARKTAASEATTALTDLVQSCASAGVALTFVRSLPKLNVSGVAYWLTPDKACITLSARYSVEDQFWFSFFHEACHVLEQSRRTVFIDSIFDPNTDPEEIRANRFARDLLVPPEEFAKFSLQGRVDSGSIARFAAEIGSTPGIVIGRLQHEKLVSFKSSLNKQKRRFKWADEAPK